MKGATPKGRVHFGAATQVVSGGFVALRATMPVGDRRSAVARAPPGWAVRDLAPLRATAPTGSRRSVAGGVIRIKSHRAETGNIPHISSTRFAALRTAVPV